MSNIYKYVNITNSVLGIGSTTFAPFSSLTFGKTQIALDGYLGTYLNRFVNGVLDNILANDVIYNLIDPAALRIYNITTPQFALVTAAGLPDDINVKYKVIDVIPNITYSWNGTAFVADDSGLIGGVSSVSSKTGDVVLTKADVGLSNIDNISDINKPISVLQQAALSLKQDLSTAVSLTGAQTLSNKTLTTPFINGPTGLVKGDVGLTNVDNISDVNKQVSAATQTAINLKQNTLTAGTNITIVGSTISATNSAGAIVSSVATRTGDVVLNKADVGLNNVDNTSDTTKPVSAIQQTAINLKQNTLTAGTNITIVGNTISSTASGSGAVSSVATRTGDIVLTKADVGLTNVDNTSDINKPVSSAVTTAINLKQDASTAATITGVQTLTNKTLTAPVINSPTGISKADVGLISVDNTSDINKPVSTAQATSIATKQAILTAGTNITIVGNTINSTASGSGAVSSVSGRTGAVVLTSADVGLSLVDNTSDITKNAATTTLTNKTLTAPVINSPTGISKADINLGNVDNTSDTTKNSTVATLSNKTLLSPIINSPSGILKGDVGLVSVDNTSDINKPVSTATQIAINLKQNTLTAGTNITIVGNTINSTASGGGTTVSSVSGRTGAVVLTSADVGLNNVDNTSDTTKNNAVATLTNKTLTAPVINSPTGISKADVGLNNVDNTSDINKPISSATQSALNTTNTNITSNTTAITTKQDASTAATITGVQTLTNKTLTAPVINSPTGILKADIGLNNVDNTSDINKPVSTAQTAANANILSQAQTFASNAANITSGTINAARLPASVIGALNYQGTWNATTNTPTLTSSTGTKGFYYKVSTTGPTILDGHTYWNLGDSVVFDGVVWDRLNGIDGQIISVSSHAPDATGNIILVKADVGLGNVDNTSDVNKPISSATQTAINLKQDAVLAATITGVQTLTNKTLTAPVINSPTGILKADVGLGNVDNTADVNKPISSAQATSIATKQAILTAGTNITIVGNTISSTASGGGGGALSPTNLQANQTFIIPDNNQALMSQVISFADNAIITFGDESLLVQIDTFGSSIGVSSAPTNLQASQTFTISDNNQVLMSQVVNFADNAIITFGDESLLVQIDTFGSGAVSSVAARTGDVVLTSTDVGLGNVDNTSDINKPVSTAGQTALATKQVTLVSGTTIKTINGTTLLGSGDIVTGASTPVTTAVSTSRNLTSADNGATLDCTVALTLTIPAGLAVGFTVVVIPPDTGNVSIASAGGVLLNGAITTLARSATNIAISVIGRSTINAYKVTGI